MDSKTLVPSRLGEVLMITFLVFIILPISFSGGFYDGYSACSRTFDCGDIQGIGYPFWGNSRPAICGVPNMNLSCSTDDSTTIQINSTNYRVRSIDLQAQTMTIARTDFIADGICVQPLVNTTTLDFSLFDYTSHDVNLTMFYGCSSSSFISSATAIPSHVNCNVPSGAVYYTLTRGDVESYQIEGCETSLVVPVLVTSEPGLGSGASGFNTAINNGFEGKWTTDMKSCVSCEGLGGKCGYNLSSYQFLCYNNDTVGYNNSTYNNPTTDMPFGTKNQTAIIRIARSTLNWRKLAIGIGVGILAVTTLVAIFMYNWRLKSSSNVLTLFWKRSARNTQNVEAFLRNYGSLAPKRYNYRDIKKMTNSFRDKVGQGGYGGVFKGKLADGRLVAVKVLNESKGNGEEFINEVASISRTSHVNVVSFLGFCFDGSKRALIYEFMSNGSLEKFIYKKCPHLGWERLYQIAIGIAKGLEYLHRGCNTRILHFDIKPHNILLDDDFCPKISDFGLAKLCPTKDSIISMADTRGTIGYIAPEVFSRYYGGVSHKSDVYSYGMMVLEMVGGRKNFDAGVGHTSENYFPDWIYKHIEQGEHLQLNLIFKEKEEEIARKMATVGLWCIQMDPANRPSISKVVDMLEGNLESLSIPPKPCVSSPARELVDSFTSSITS